MNRFGHIIFGACVSALFISIMTYFDSGWYSITFGSVLTFAIIILIYSLLPDIDHRGGTMTWWFIGIGILGVVMGIMQLIFSVGTPTATLVISALLLIMTFLAAHMRHRGFIHTIWAGILFSIPLYFLLDGSYAFLGYVAFHSHLFGDGYILKMW